MGVNRDFKDLFAELSAADARFIVVGKAPLGLETSEAASKRAGKAPLGPEMKSPG